LDEQHRKDDDGDCRDRPKRKNDEQLFFHWRLLPAGDALAVTAQ
jgi:hypothetical protein